MVHLVVDITVRIQVTSVSGLDEERIVNTVSIVGDLRADGLNIDGGFQNVDDNLSVPEFATDGTVLTTGHHVLNGNFLGDILPLLQGEVKGIETRFGNIRTEGNGISGHVFQNQRIQSVRGADDILTEYSGDSINSIHGIALGSNRGTSEHVHDKFSGNTDLGKGVNHHRGAVAVLLIVDRQIHGGVFVVIGLRINVDVKGQGVIGRIVVGIVVQNGNNIGVQNRRSGNHNIRIVLHHEIAGGGGQVDVGLNTIDVFKHQTGEHIVAGCAVLPSYRHCDGGDVSSYRIVHPTKLEAVNTGENLGHVSVRLPHINRMVPEGEAQGIDITGHFLRGEQFQTILVNLEIEAGQGIRETVRMTDEVECIDGIGLVLLAALDIEAGMDDGILVGGNHINRRIFGPVFNRKAECSGNSGHLHALGFRQSMGTVREHVRRKTSSVSPFPGDKLKGIETHRMHIRHKFERIFEHVSQAERRERCGFGTVTRNAAGTIGEGQRLVIPFQFQMTEIGEVTSDNGVHNRTVK